MKVIYFNKETGKEVHYGEGITFKESGKFASGYSYQSVVTVPIINATIPDLIKKGVWVQKEVEDNSESLNKLTIEEKLAMIVTGLNILINKVQKLEEYLYDEV